MSDDAVGDSDFAGLNARAINALRDMGITTKAQARETSESHMLKYRRVGRKTLAVINEWCRRKAYEEQAWIDEKCRRYIAYLNRHGYAVEKKMVSK